MTLSDPRVIRSLGSFPPVWVESSELGDRIEDIDINPNAKTRLSKYKS